MSDEKFDDLMRDAAQSYNRPPDVPPLDVMWEEVERRVARTREEAESVAFPVQRSQWSALKHPWVRMAAMLVVGVGVGRFSVTRAGTPEQVASAPAIATAASNSGIPSEYELVTDQYLGEAAALLISLPAELDNRRPGAAFLSRADDLLLQTRMLLDSPAASDPSLHTLFEDLEVVLAQVVRLEGSDRDPTRIDLLHQALEQRDVIPRLRNAVADHIAD